MSKLTAGTSKSECVREQNSNLNRERILELASERFGYRELRPGQEEAIRSVLNGRDTLVVAPTGSGKSAIYQLAGMLLKGAVLVVSPLIALQKDQVEAIEETGLEEGAVVINSTKRFAELREQLEKVKAAESKFVFLAPEQLAKQETLEALRQAGVCLFVVDEAHCVSEWGRDFRPDYLRLGHVVEQLGHPTVLAVTATAAPEVRDEIASRLCMKAPEILVGGFDRPNIHLRVDRFKEPDKKLEDLLHRVRWADKPGIIYVGTRKDAESIMAGLEEEGIKALFYHGGMKASERDAVQDRFMSGEAEVIVATNAFGMGIDKNDVRFVYHFSAPDSLDAYYQEIGRAGRDGERAEAVLFFREEDIGAQAFHNSRGSVDAESFEKIAFALDGSKRALTQEQIAEKTGLNARKLAGILQQMEDAGAVKSLKSGAVRLTPTPDLVEAATTADEQQERLKQRNKDRLEQMRSYADTAECRRALLLQYFGDTAPDSCGNCDNCESKAPEAVVDSGAGTRREVA